LIAGMSDNPDMGAAEDQGGGKPALYRPPNKMWHKVTAGGRIASPGFDADLLKQAEKMAAPAFEAFDQALDEAIERLVLVCDRLEIEGVDREQAWPELRASADEMTDFGTKSGYNLLSRFGESLAVFLDKAEAPEDIAVEVARAHVDSMRLIYTQGRTGDGGDVGQRLSQALDATLVRFAAKPS
jgi:hypothetical protein